MNADGSRKKENVLRTYRTAEDRLEKRIKKVMGEIRGADGKPPSRAIARVMYGEGKPVGMLGRRLLDIHEADSPLEDAERLVYEVLDWLRTDVYNRSKNSDRAGATMQ